ncbi:hypothetical protein AB0M46_47990 [Dactylosporangium sp. NPDC051485]|uniref:WXG100 family type VII secretion target n=1 Tax=Dactylosporangium sp. NPDC051485 TaxID=3154846 RepID=UPI00341A420C
MGAETRVDPGVLDGLARTVRELGDDLDTSMGWLEPNTGAAVSALRGFDSANALERLHLAWEDAAKGFGRHLRSMGDALGACARDYRYTDHAAAGNFAGLER